MKCERCGDAQSRLAKARQSSVTAQDAIQRGAEAQPTGPGRWAAPSSCPHCGHCLWCGSAPVDGVPARGRLRRRGTSRGGKKSAADGPYPGTETLTSREQEVLLLLATGMSNRHIARQLGIAEKTVKNHLAAIFAKLGVHARTQAAVYAIEAGMQG